MISMQILKSCKSIAYAKQEEQKSLGKCGLPDFTRVMDIWLIKIVEKPLSKMMNHFDTKRAIAEMALAYVAIKMGMPILAICGGHQILNVCLGGKLKEAEINDDIDLDDGYLQYSMNTFDSSSELGQVIF